MNATPAIRRPILARYARYRWDAIRAQHQVVYPEAALVLNDTGAAIVNLCDGREIEAVVAELERASNQPNLIGDVTEFLQGLAEQGLLRDAAS